VAYSDGLFAFACCMIDVDQPPPSKRVIVNLIDDDRPVPTTNATAPYVVFASKRQRLDCGARSPWTSVDRVENDPIPGSAASNGLISSAADLKGAFGTMHHCLKHR